jgi:hypothetical protein
MIVTAAAVVPVCTMYVRTSVVNPRVAYGPTRIFEPVTRGGSPLAHRFSPSTSAGDP